jgi:hypothetical protein
MTEPMRVFVGTDESQILATNVLEYSIRKHASRPVEFHRMTVDGMPMPKDHKNRPRTGFSFCRFTIPQRCGYRDRALYLDADMLVFTDIAELWRIPFDDQTLLCTWQGEPPPDWRNNPMFKTGRHYAVMLLDCERLHWDVRDVIRGLDEGRYSYQQLMYDMCIVAPDAIDHRLATEWNSLENYVPGTTKNIHYTVVPTQPWKCRTNPHGAVWDQHLEEAIAARMVTREQIESGVRKGLVHADLLRFVRSTGTSAAKTPELTPPQPFVPPRHTLLFHLQLVTDFDLLVPLLVEARRRPGVDARLVVDSTLLAKVPQLKEQLLRRGLMWYTASLEDFQRARLTLLDGISALITATESSARPHAAAHALTAAAKGRGIPTFTLQHGFENVGLTWFDHVHTPANTQFLSDAILTWGPTSLLDERADPSTRARCLPVGCFKELLPARGRLQRPSGRERFVAVLENLHWHRFDDAYRERFLADLAAAARVQPDTTWFVRPHPAGAFLTSRFRGELPRAPNLVIADPNSPEWRQWQGPELFAIADLVITTPSTVALDAARCGTPVAVVGYGQDLTRYAPLPVITSADDWTRFADVTRRASERSEIIGLGARFVARVTTTGDAAARAIDQVLVKAVATVPHAATQAAGAAEAEVARLQQQLRDLRSSWTWRLGRMLTKPLDLLRRGGRQHDSSA